MRSDAAAVVRDHFLPRYKKAALDIHSERDVEGRAAESGRGMDQVPCRAVCSSHVCMYVCVWSQGRCYVYSMHGITYRVVADDDGLFNGSDEFACKADNLPYHTTPYHTLPYPASPHYLRRSRLLATSAARRWSSCSWAG